METDFRPFMSMNHAPPHRYSDTCICRNTSWASPDFWLDNKTIRRLNIKGKLHSFQVHNYLQTSALGCEFVPAQNKCFTLNHAKISSCCFHDNMGETGDKSHVPLCVSVLSQTHINTPPGSDGRVISELLVKPGISLLVLGTRRTFSRLWISTNKQRSLHWDIFPSC